MSDETHGLVLPFVACETRGGEYGDESYCAGWEAAGLWNALEAHPEQHEATLRVGNRAQADLIAMNFGYLMEWREADETWATATFTKEKPHE